MTDQPATSTWFHETPASPRLLAEERAIVEAAEQASEASAARERGRLGAILDSQEQWLRDEIITDDGFAAQVGRSIIAQIRKEMWSRS